MLVTHSGAVFGTKISYILDVMSVGATGLWHVFVLSLIYKKIYEKIIWKKTVAIYNVFKKKTTKIILEKKI